ncbi:TB2/DP1, HVA22 family-domain-containing protein [Xylogone sp. PMI_703]|nr:TB2/DP1, HVA22 family-domain-containing protein [Xylogone sp. PMI_703]
MFDLFPNLLSSLPTFLFPVFASYKALKTSDPALLAPWLIYWVILACVLLVESWLWFILFWIPFYGWFRLIFLLYLILPQTQGARYLYEEYLNPWLRENELVIDDFISTAHERAMAAGLDYLNQAIEFVKTNVFGLPPRQPSPPPTPSTFSYAQSLISRFNMPSARSGTTPRYGGSTGTSPDFYSLLASAVSAVASASTPDRETSSGSLIPSTIRGEERVTFIAAQRERLSVLLSALDREAAAIQSGGGPRGTSERPKSALSGLSKSRSETDFEKIDAESGSEGENANRHGHRDSGGAWLPWGWSGTSGDSSDPSSHSSRDREARGRSTGIDS